MADTLLQFPRVPATPSRPYRPITGSDLPGTNPGNLRTAGRPAGQSQAVTARTQSPEPIPIDVLYPATEGAVSNLVKALSLLGDAISLLDNARIAITNREDIVADRFVQRFQHLLPQLFAARNIGDGYAVIVNSLHFGFINQAGRPLTLEQITTVWRMLRELRNAPFVQFDQALEQVSEIEASDFRVDPPILSAFTEAEDDE